MQILRFALLGVLVLALLAIVAVGVQPAPGVSADTTEKNILDGLQRQQDPAGRARLGQFP